MTVNELIKVLQQMPQDAPVAYYDAEFDTHNAVTRVRVIEAWGEGMDDYEFREPTNARLPRPQEKQLKIVTLDFNDD